MHKHLIIILIASVVLAGCSHTQAPTTTSSEPGSNTVPIELAESEVETASSIRLTSPRPGQVLKSPFLVGGEAQLPQNLAYVRVTNPQGDILISEEVSVKAGASELGPFSVLLSFVFKATDRGIVEVYGIDPETGTEIAVESVNVSFDTSTSGTTIPVQ
jgi:hypothetical protein